MPATGAINTTATNVAEINGRLSVAPPAGGGPEPLMILVPWDRAPFVAPEMRKTFVVQRSKP